MLAGSDTFKMWASAIETIWNLPIARQGDAWPTAKQVRDVIGGKRTLAVHIGEITYASRDPIVQDIFNGISLRQMMCCSSQNYLTL